MTDDAEDDGVVEHVSADDAFGLLGDDTRLGVLRALSDADGRLGFADLRAAVGVADSGQFNYHLDRLVGQFVARDEDGYRLTPAGRRVVGTVLAGQYTKAVESDPVPVDADCTHCGGPLAADFEGWHARVACDDCDRNVIRLEVPPGAFEEYPREEWPRVAERWTRNEFRSVVDGFCPNCHGPITSTLRRDPEDVLDVYPFGVHYACDRCDTSMFANVEAHVLFRPAVVAFHHERGIDVTETALWDLDWAVTPRAEAVSTDPLRVEVPVAVDGDELRVTVDADAAVVAERRG
ncbi:winged helix-turn-helix domain-containing protein [Halostella litorea]|uniref:winged helix-turn-helix domain-containing protein n=1 Tax=Halostella litorea TaxID=2528831 RepID=UPI0010929229|nr:winged helix-turn-helix domain-containing protein [Halostella litorea]